jgi:hypothetical protein
MREQSLNDRILKVILLSGTALTASEIIRMLPDAIEAPDLASRLTIMVKRNDLETIERPRVAKTGKRTVKAYFIKNITKTINCFNFENNSHQLNIFQLLPQTQ